MKRSQKIDICSDYSFLMDWPFYNDELSLSLEIIFILKSVLSDINMVIWLSFDNCLHAILLLAAYFFQSKVFPL